MPREPRTLSVTDRALLVASAGLPALLAAGRLELHAGAARDAAVVSTVGLGFTGGLHALDTWLAAPFAWLPLGTRTLRAELPGVALLAAVAALSFVRVRELLAVVADHPAWASVVAALATATATVSGTFLHEASNVGSCLAGVVLALVALRVAPEGRAARPLKAALTALALSYDRGLGACVLAALLSPLLLRLLQGHGRAPPEPTSRFAPALVVAAAAGGLVPFGLSALRERASPLLSGVSLFAPPPLRDAVLEGAGLRHVVSLVDRELGVVLAALAATGLVLSFLRRRAWPEAFPLAALTLAAYVVLAERSQGTRESWGPSGLIALLGTLAFAAVAMHEAVVRVSRLRLPLASASAAMVVVLLAAFPAMVLDESLVDVDSSASRGVPAWEDAAFTGLSGGTLLLVSAPRLGALLLASKASGELPGDVEVLPTFEPTGEAFASTLRHDAKLIPLFRDLALAGVPEELSLSTLAAARPLAVATDPRWDRALTRHLLPGGLFADFEPEPRGGGDRKRALLATAPARARLASVLLRPPVSTLAALTASMLFDRSLAEVATGEREVALLALQDTSLFAPKDARVQELTLRELSARGPVDVHDLVREGLAGEPP